MQEHGNWKPCNSKAIINNIELVFKTGDITKLNNPTYNFINLLGGFIAHYNLNGFQCYYKDLREFAKDLLNATQEWDCKREETDMDFIKWYGTAYCSSKAQAMRGIREVVNKYQNKTQETNQNKDYEKIINLQSLVNEVIKRNDIDLTRLLVKKLEL